MGSKQEFISLEGLRVDGRRPREIRKIKFELGVLPRADGSCILEQGMTKVMVAVYGPGEVRGRADHGSKNAVILVNYSSAAFSGNERKKKLRYDKQQAEVCQAVKATFEGVILTRLYPQSQIEIFIEVLQTDGNAVCTCLNGATLALVDAGIPMQDYLIACNAGYIDGTALVDTNAQEDLAGGPRVPVAVLARSQKICHLQLDHKLSRELFDEVLKTAMEGCTQIFNVLDTQIKEHARRQLESASVVSST
eukprot:TRINITY_DN67613_c9_g3_i1.p1 TRINITY_DN67613_c9_g3~~TRINITY_DN67613_c9_g3_i1.p1  ORF type:complete len:250 (+),score=16.83 TRINITY_DN67613_c9_g3_i1:70-819(+)